MKLNFTKMQALGNDFILIDDRDGALRRISSLAEKLCDRRFGIGADQLLLLCHSNVAEFRMRIFNADGSEVEMCGNGIRCLGKYILDDILRCEESPYAKRYCQSIDVLTVETLAGIRQIFTSSSLFKIDLGEPVFEASAIPVRATSVAGSIRDGKVIGHRLKAGNMTHEVNCLSVGNPHAVLFVKNIKEVDVGTVGPLIENHATFPNRTNVEFVEVKNRNTIHVRVWERGAGETLACGTGASASAVMSAVLGRTAQKVNVHLPGGKLSIHWNKKDNHVYMTGPAEKVFTGSIDI
jgi:diaminopimelate epimerase